MAKHYWVLKSEKETYSWADLVRDGRTEWTGVRNFAARLHLRAMKQGDLAVFYHSGEDKEAVGLARIVRAAYPDPTAKDGDWSAVDIAPVKPLQRAVSLAEIKSDKVLKDIPLARISRLSISPIGEAQFKRLLTLAETKP